MLCRLAGYVFDIKAKHTYIPRLCHDYIVENGADVDFTVSVTEEELAAEAIRQPTQRAPYLEGTCAIRQITDWLAPRGVVLLHAAVVCVDGVAYAFSAPSGTGKSTHVCLWLEMLKERAFVLNGDKPFLKKEADGTLRVYGSPWCGKEGWNRNTSAPLGGLCFLERAAGNRIRRMAPSEGVVRIFSQLLRPSTMDGVDATLTMANDVLTQVPVWLLGCNISKEAAELSFGAMHGGGKDML